VTPVGMVKRSAVPCGARGATHSCPPWASMIDRQIESPIPRPSGFVVKKGSKMRGREHHFPGDPHSR
jgi:hypothetical protein